MAHKGFSVIHFDHDGHSHGEVFPVALEFSLLFKEVSTLSYEVEIGTHMSTRESVDPYVTDFLLTLDEIPIMGGIHTEIDRSDLESNALKVAGRDWSHYFEKRIYPFDPTNPTPFVRVQQDITDIVADLLDDVLNVPYSLDFGYTFTPVGNQVNFKIDPANSQDVYRHLKDLSEQGDGFDFEITYDRRIIMSPDLGNHVNDFTLIEGYNIEDIRYNNTGPEATWVLGIGSGTSNKLGKIAKDDALSSKYRLLEAVEDFGTVRSEEMLQQKVDAEFKRRSIPMISFGCTFVDQDVNVFEKLHPGDWIQVEADLDWDVISDEFRVVGMRGAQDETGFITVELTFDDGKTPL